MEEEEFVDEVDLPESMRSIIARVGSWEGKWTRGPDWEGEERWEVDDDDDDDDDEEDEEGEAEVWDRDVVTAMFRSGVRASVRQCMCGVCSVSVPCKGGRSSLDRCGSESRGMTGWGRGHDCRHAGMTGARACRKCGLTDARRVVVDEIV